MSFRDELPAHPPYLPSALFQTKPTLQVVSCESVQTALGTSLRDDFFNGEDGELGWTFYGAPTPNSRTEKGHPGIVRPVSGIVPDAVHAMHLGFAPTAPTVVWNDVDSITAIFAPVDGSGVGFTSASFRIGLFSDIADDSPTDGVYYEKGGAFDYGHGCTRDGGSETITANFATEFVSGEWQTITIRRVSDFVVDFTVNGETLSCTSNTPSPLTEMILGIQWIPTTADPQAFDLDFIELQFVALER